MWGKWIFGRWTRWKSKGFESMPQCREKNDDYAIGNFKKSGVEWSEQRGKDNRRTLNQFVGMDSLIVNQGTSADIHTTQLKKLDIQRCCAWTRKPRMDKSKEYRQLDRCSLMGRVYGNRGYRSRIMFSARYHCRMPGARFLGSKLRCVDIKHYC